MQIRWLDNGDQTLDNIVNGWLNIFSNIMDRASVSNEVEVTYGRVINYAVKFKRDDAVPTSIQVSSLSYLYSFLEGSCGIYEVMIVTYDGEVDKARTMRDRVTESFGVSACGIAV
jgi:hypothetical protein